MANTSAPYGFRQYSGFGSVPTYEQSTAFANYNASAIYFGDVVAQQADGSIAIASPGTNPIAGIFVGCKYLSVGQKKTVWSNYWPGSDVASGNTVECYVVNDPNALFIAQTGGSTTVGLTAADVGSNVQFAVGSPNAANGISGAYIDMATAPAITTTFPFRVIGLVVDPPGSNGTAAGAYNYAIVGFNNEVFKQLAGI